jgi:hypothetical protein
MAKIFTYSPQKVILAFGGYTITGWQTLTVERGADGFIPIKGIRGKHTRSRNPDTSCTITVPLLQTSMSNDVFSRIHELDLANGTGRIELTLKDTGGTTVMESIEAYILGYPTVVYSDGFSYHVWKIFCQYTNITVGGNAQVSNIFSGILGAASGVVDSVSSFL